MGKILFDNNHVSIEASRDGISLVNAGGDAVVFLYWSELKEIAKVFINLENNA